MPQSSYEVIKRSIEFTSPDRLGTRVWGEDTGDVFEIALDWRSFTPPPVDSQTYLDHFGCLWLQTDKRNMGQIKGHPLEDLSKLASFMLPDTDADALYTQAEQRLQSAGDKYVLAFIGFFVFERMQALRGFENTLCDLYADPDVPKYLADMLEAHYMGIIRNLSKRYSGRIHGFGFTEDWGTQSALMIDPGMWRSIFKPIYRRLFDAIHQAGWHVWMHSCGKINEIVEDLIGIGVNVINLQQPLALGIVELGQQFSGRICFEATCDIQRTLVTGGEADITSEVSELLRYWALPTGGLIVSVDNDDALYISKHNVKAMRRAFKDSDPYRQVA